MTNEMTDDEYVAARREQDERDYLIAMVDPAKAPRLAPAVSAMKAALQDGAMTWNSVMATGLRSSDVAAKTLDNVLRKLLKHGFLLKQGEYTRTFNRRSRKWQVKDTRSLRLGEWPEPE